MLTHPYLSLSRSGNYCSPGGIRHHGSKWPRAVPAVGGQYELMASIYDLTENDHRHGHQRVYDWETLRRDVTAAGYDVVGRHGLALKLFADFQNEKMIEAGIIGDAQLRGLWAFGQHLPWLTKKVVERLLRSILPGAPVGAATDGPFYLYRDQYAAAFGRLLTAALFQL